jgi:hypothetical protein
MCVNTIVRTRPIAACQAHCQQRRKGGQQIGPKEQTAQLGHVQPKAQIVPVGDQALHDEGTGKRVKGEQRREFDDDGAGGV